MPGNRSTVQFRHLPGNGGNNPIVKCPFLAEAADLCSDALSQSVKCGGAKRSRGPKVFADGANHSLEGRIRIS